MHLASYAPGHARTRPAGLPGARRAWHSAALAAGRRLQFSRDCQRMQHALVATHFIATSPQTFAFPATPLFTAPCAAAELGRGHLLALGGPLLTSALAPGAAF